MFSVENVEINNNKNNLFKSKLFIISIISLFLIVLFIGIYVFFKTGDEYKDIKDNKNEDIVYTVYERKNNKDSYTEVPKININSKEVKKINKEIYKDLGEFLGKKTNACSYSYEINGDILSVVIEMIDYNTGYTPELKFKTYNIDLSTLKVIIDEELLDLYGVDEDYVETKIKNKFNKFYKQEVKEGYLDYRECNYECFLSWRNVKDYMDNVEYYISDSKLYAYKEFTAFSIFGEENFYKEKDYLFYIAD